jgi:hypothetical protein
MGKSRKVVRKDNEKGGSRKHRQRARDSDKDSAEDFVAVPDYPGLRAKNVTAAKKRSVNKLVRTQSNKWINIFGKAPTLETFVDKNIANYIAKGFDEHPNPSQRKSTLSFLKHMSQRLGIVHVGSISEQPKFPLTQEQLDGMRNRREYKGHKRRQAETFTGVEYTRTLSRLTDEVEKPPAGKARALQSKAIFLTHFDAGNRPSHVLNTPVTEVIVVYPEPHVGARHVKGECTYTKTSQNQSSSAQADDLQDKVASRTRLFRSNCSTVFLPPLLICFFLCLIDSLCRPGTLPVRVRIPCTSGIWCRVLIRGALSPSFASSRSTILVLTTPVQRSSRP